MKWISVDDELPKSDDEFLVVLGGTDVIACFFNPWLSDPQRNREYSFHWFTEQDIPSYGSERCEMMGVTHWMPFPPPPTK